MNILALEKIIENMKQTEALLFAQHRDAEHPENCKWGVAWKAQEEARKALESLLSPTSPTDKLMTLANNPWKTNMAPAVSYSASLPNK